MSDESDDNEMLIEFIPDDFSDDEAFALMMTIFAKSMDKGLDHERAYEYIYIQQVNQGITYDNVEDLANLIKKMRTDDGKMH